MKKKPAGKIAIILAIILIALAAATGIYLGNYYHASDEALAGVTEEHENYTIYREGNNLVFAPENADTGFIFYPGAKVQMEAYAPLMEHFADAGVFCVLVKMPGNIAFLDYNAAGKILEEYPQITHWYIGGHSLGGVSAAMFLGKHADEFEGLLLLGSYSITDLSQTELKVMTVYGTEDRVLNSDKFSDNMDNINTLSGSMGWQIAGGCHSYFGDYGMQKGDGTPTITREEQMEQVTESLLELISW